MGVRELAEQLTLAALLDEVRLLAGRYELLDHWQQGEFHHDTLIRVDHVQAGLPGPILVIATNCNGGVKEVLCFGERPDRYALWHRRCPSNAEFSGELPPVLDVSTTVHWFNPCKLLSDQARSELRAEFRERQLGGGWAMKSCSVSKRDTDAI